MKRAEVEVTWTSERRRPLVAGVVCLCLQPLIALRVQGPVCEPITLPVPAPSLQNSSQPERFTISSYQSRAWDLGNSRVWLWETSYWFLFQNHVFCFPKLFVIARKIFCGRLSRSLGPQITVSMRFNQGFRLSSPLRVRRILGWGSLVLVALVLENILWSKMVLLHFGMSSFSSKSTSSCKNSTEATGSCQ